MAVLAAALRDAKSQALKMQALCAWRVFVSALAACGAGRQQQGEEPLLGRVAQQAVVVLMEALESGGQASAADIIPSNSTPSVCKC